MADSPFAPLPGHGGKLHDFNDQGSGEWSGNQNLLHAIRGGVMGGNEYRVMNVPRAFIYRIGAISMADNSSVTFDTTLYDTDSMVDTSAYTALFCKTPGVYHVSANFTFGASVAGNYRGGYLLVNNTVSYGNVTLPFVTGGFGTNVTMQADIPMVKGDYVQAVVSQNIGGPIAMVVGTSNNRWLSLSATLLSTL